jgi:hypothetical protein
MPATGARADYEPGDVLVIGADGLLTKCAESHSTKLVGAYSSKPGFLGDRRITKHGVERIHVLVSETEELWLPVALLGVVPVKASAENGPIQVGDILTTARTPGHAMRANPLKVEGGQTYATGTVLGKSLGSLSGGTAKIQVLIMLR